MLVLAACGAPVWGEETAAERADVTRGLAVFLDRDLGHCVLCHAVAQLDVPFQGNIGPALTDVADRLSREEMEQKIMDPTRSNPQSAMPAYFRTRGLRQVAQAYVGKPVLNRQQLDDLLAYLGTLQSPGGARSPAGSRSPGGVER